MYTCDGHIATRTCATRVHARHTANTYTQGRADTHGGKFGLSGRWMATCPRDIPNDGT